MSGLETFRPRRWLVAASLIALACAACGSESDVAKPNAGATEPPAKKTPVGKNVIVEVDGKTGARRVIVASEVVLREGQLEGFLTRKGGKEHEYILAADCDAKDIHKALLVAGAEAGHPVSFGPGNTVKSATGSMIRVSMRYTGKNGKQETLPASEWITNAINNKPLEYNWVFAGSRLIPDPDNRNRPPFYEANIGDLIAVVNMPSAMLDLPVASAKALEMRQYVANKANIPPVKTKVDVILEVLPEKKGDGALQPVPGGQVDPFPGEKSESSPSD